MIDPFSFELESLESQGLKRHLTPGLRPGVTNLSSNDYLGLSHHPDVVAAAKSAIEKYGVGGTSSRLLAGTSEAHTQLEQNLSRFLSRERALVFSSGYHVNTGLLSSIVGPQSLVLFDRASHASIIDGIRLSRSSFASFNHNDEKSLEQELRKRRAGKDRCVIVTEGFFSMDGDRSPLQSLVRLAKEYDALIYLDEAHSFGVAGPHGQGEAAEQNVLKDVDIFVGTLSKSLGSQGGFVSGSQSLIDLLVSKSRSFIFTTALAPACAAAAAAALSLLPSMQDRRERVLKMARRIREELIQMGFDCFNCNPPPWPSPRRGEGTSFFSSPIVPVWTGEIAATKKLSEHLLSHGFFVPSIRPPTVPVGEGRVRLSICHDINDETLEKLTGVFSRYPDRPRRKEKIVDPR